MAEHAKFSASSSHRWLKCPASFKACESIPETTSKYAAEGTLAHDLAARCLNGDNYNHLGSIINKSGFYLLDAPDDVPTADRLVTEEMGEYIGSYVAYVNSLKGSIDLIETKVDYSYLVPEGFGTADYMTIIEDTLHVCDLKYGKGVKVKAKENTQLMLYALGALHEYDWAEINNVKLHIYQPRCANIDVWGVSIEELKEFEIYVKKQVKKCLSKNPKFIPGDHQCRFCAYKPWCKALQKHLEEALSCEFENLDETKLKPETVNIKAVLDARDLLHSFVNAVETRAYAEFLEGNKVDGYKLVESKTNHKWKDEEIVVTVLKDCGCDEDVIFVKKIISPSQALKLVEKSHYEKLVEHIIKPDGKPILVQESDLREPINLAENMFEKLDLKPNLEEI